jgi:hypothetical protein
MIQEFEKQTFVDTMDKIYKGNATFAYLKKCTILRVVIFLVSKPG